MSGPALDLYQRHRLTVHDFHRMGEAGILPVAGRLELIEGEIMDMAPIGSRHAAVCVLVLAREVPLGVRSKNNQRNARANR